MRVENVVHGSEIRRGAAAARNAAFLSLLQLCLLLAVTIGGWLPLRLSLLLGLTLLWYALEVLGVGELCTPVIGDAFGAGRTGFLARAHDAAGVDALGLLAVRRVANAKHLVFVLGTLLSAAGVSAQIFVAVIRFALVVHGPRGAREGVRRRAEVREGARVVPPLAWIHALGSTHGLTRPPVQTNDDFALRVVFGVLRSRTSGARTEVAKLNERLAGHVLADRTRRNLDGLFL
jgi:hypothetical protein